MSILQSDELSTTLITIRHEWTPLVKRALWELSNEYKHSYVSPQTDSFTLMTP